MRHEIACSDDGRHLPLVCDPRMTVYYVVANGYCNTTLGITTTPRAALVLWARMFVRVQPFYAPCIRVVECGVDGQEEQSVPLDVKDLPPEELAVYVRDARRLERVRRAVARWRFIRNHEPEEDGERLCFWSCPCPRARVRRNEQAAAKSRLAGAAFAAALLRPQATE
jgi:hypothetical protein